MKGKELTDYVLERTQEASELFNSLDKDKYTQGMAFSIRAGKARGYLHGLGNFYNSFDDGKLDENHEKGFINDFREYYAGTVKEEIDKVMYGSAKFKLPGAKARRSFTGALGLLLGSGVIFWPGRDHKLIAIVCALLLGTRMWEAHRLIKSCNNTIKKYEAQEGAKLKVYSIKQDELKTVLLDKRAHIMPLLPE